MKKISMTCASLLFGVVARSGCASPTSEPEHAPIPVTTSTIAPREIVLGTLFHTDVALPSSATTLFFGLLWARVVRARRGGRPVGWLVAVPLAAMNAGAAFCIVHGVSVGSFVGAAVFGVVIWGPALVVTLLIFGVPRYRAQRAADHGLGSEDRGERIVGAVAAAIAALTLVALPFAASLASRTPADWDGEGAPETPAPLAVGGLAAIAVGGLGAGLAALVYATRRERARRRFVSDVERGAKVGYRIDSQRARRGELPRGTVEVEGLADG